jgi:hypothetical protein
VNEPNNIKQDILYKIFICHLNGNNNYYFKYYSLCIMCVSYYQCNLFLLFVILICLVIEKSYPLFCYLCVLKQTTKKKKKKEKKEDVPSYYSSSHFLSSSSFFSIHACSFFLSHLNDDNVHFSAVD